MTMVDRVAAAIVRVCEHQNWDPDGMARAAIEAMREPTMEVIAAGGYALDNCKDSGWDSGSDGESHNTYEYIVSGSQTTIYQAMIDAALADEKAQA